MAGFVADNHYGWTFVPYLQAFGGNVFRKAAGRPVPDAGHAGGDRRGGVLRPNLLKEFGPDGAITYTPDQVAQALQARPRQLHR